MSVGVTRLRYSPAGVGVPLGNGDSAGFVALKSGDVLVLDHGPLRGKRYVEQVPAVPVQEITADTTLTVQANGKTLKLNSTTSRVVTLPRARDAKGMVIQSFYAALVTVGSGHKFTPATGDFIGAGVTALGVVAGESVQLGVTTDAVGDKLTLRSNGVNGWTVTFTRGGDLSKVA